MTEFWERAFVNKQMMWGEQAADSVKYALNLFKAQDFKKILIPGFGYGRNAVPFIENGFDVSGIEISKTAIELAKKNLGERIQVYHGSVCEMPFSQDLYDGVFCYALIHLLNKDARINFISDCYHQLKHNGYMVFVAVSTSDAMFGEGIKIDHNCYKTRHGIELFFYNMKAIEIEFGKFGLIDAVEINDPEEIVRGKPGLKFWQITCKKTENGSIKNG